MPMLRMGDRDVVAMTMTHPDAVATLIADRSA